MNETEKVMADATLVANMHNDMVVCKALRDYEDLYCPHCSYPANMTQWQELLKEYILAKKYLHRAKKHAGDSFMRIWRIAATIRTEMRQHEPCECCKALFNPTNRIRRSPADNQRRCPTERVFSGRDDMIGRFFPIERTN